MDPQQIEAQLQKMALTIALHELPLDQAEGLLGIGYGDQVDPWGVKDEYWLAG